MKTQQSIPPRSRLDHTKERLAGALFRLENALEYHELKSNQVKEVHLQVVHELDSHIKTLESLLYPEDGKEV